jgi:carbon-monoxide dehydrogenase medium subunit
MKAAAFDYARPGSVGDAVELLARSKGSAKVIAGGQSLGPMLNLRLAQPQLLVDIRHIRELNEVRQTQDGYMVGSCVTHAAVEDGEVPDFTRGFMRKVATGIAYRAVRNRGTIGGSVCHADPAADWVVALTLLSAVAIVEGPEGRREIGLGEFVTGPFSTQLDQAQILVGIRIPGLSARARWSYCKICRKPGEFAETIGAILHDDHSGICRAVIGATHGTPFVIEDARFVAERYEPERVRAALEAAGVAHDSYERQIHNVVLKRAAFELAAA